jgi:hypothetical protein
VRWSVTLSGLDKGGTRSPPLAAVMDAGTRSEAYARVETHIVSSKQSVGC